MNQHNFERGGGRHVLQQEVFTTSVVNPWSLAMCEVGFPAYLQEVPLENICPLWNLTPVYARPPILLETMLPRQHHYTREIGPHSCAYAAKDATDRNRSQLNFEPS